MGAHTHACFSNSLPPSAGALVVTPSGDWPVMTPDTSARIRSALARAEITMWELYEVDNSCCSDPPLGLPPILGGGKIGKEEDAAAAEEEAGVKTNNMQESTQ